MTKTAASSFKIYLPPLIITLLGLAGRVAVHYLSNDGDFSRVIYPDERNYYIAGAKLFLEQGWEFFLTPRSLWNGPLNLLWVALWGPDNIAAIKLANLCLLSLLGILIWDIVRRFNPGSVYKPLFALVLCSALPPFFVFGPTLLTEAPFSLLLVLSFWIFQSGPKLRLKFLAGFIMALAALTRPTVQLLPFFFIAGVIGFACLNTIFTKKQNYSAAFKAFSAFLVGFLILVLPWLIKNYNCCSKIGIANGSGAVLFLGNDLRKNGDEPIYLRMSFDTFEVSRPYSHLDTEGDAKLTRKAIEMIKAHPWESFKLTLKKPFKYLFGYPRHYFFPYDDIISFYKQSGLSKTVKKLFEIILTAFVVLMALMGLVGFVLKDIIFVTFQSLEEQAEHSSQFTSLIFVNKLFIFFITFYFVALHTVTFPIPRLALPLFPFLLVAAFSLNKSWLTKKSNYLVIAVLTLSVAAFLALIGLSFTLEEVSKNYRDFFSSQQELPLTSTKLKGLVIEGINKNIKDSEHSFDISSQLLRQKGKSPAIVLKTDSFQSEKNQLLLLSMKASCEGAKAEARGRLFWSKAGDNPHFTESNSMSFTFSLDGEERYYRLASSFSPAWQGEIGWLKLSLPKVKEERRACWYKINSFVLVK